MSFVAKWTEDIWPVVEKKYNDLLHRRPAKQDMATGTHYGDKVFEFLATKKGAPEYCLQSHVDKPSGEHKPPV